MKPLMVQEENYVQKKHQGKIGEYDIVTSMTARQNGLSHSVYISGPTGRVHFTRVTREENKLQIHVLLLSGNWPEHSDLIMLANTLYIKGDPLPGIIQGGSKKVAYGKTGSTLSLKIILEEP